MKTKLHALPSPEDKRPLIRVIAGQLPDAADRAERVLIDRSAGYRRGTSLVRVVSFESSGASSDGIKRAPEASVIVPFDRPALIDGITRAAKIEKFDGRSESWKSIDCPVALADTLIARLGANFPPLTAVVSCPTMRADGTIIEEPGYDPETGILFQTSTAWPAVPKQPTQADALAALDVLAHSIRGFPYVSNADRSAALALILTALVRPCLPTAPLIGVTAPTPGTGKSFLVDFAAILATGTTTPVVAATGSDEELEKRIGAALMAGDTVLSLDNVERPLRSEFLCQALTQESVKLRILGQSRNLDLPTRVTMVATGNSLRFAGDLVRRVVLIRLDAGVERPEERSFDFDPRAWARQNRQELVIAALTILRAFIVSKAPPVRPALGGFADWSDLVRSAIVWLGLPDPLTNAEQVRADDPEKERNGAILAALPSEPWTAQDIARRIDVAKAYDRAYGDVPDQGLVDALADFIGRDGRLDKRGFGYWCRKQRDRIIDGRRLVQAGTDKTANAMRWKVV
jgi:putative DNA primase/helicase